MSQPSTSSISVPTSNDASSIEFEEILLQSGAFSSPFRELIREADGIEILAKKLMEQAQKIVKQRRQERHKRDFWQFCKEMEKRLDSLL